MNRRVMTPPPTRRCFATIWGELEYLCKKIHYWLYTRKQRPRALRYLDRLERVLRALPENDLAIIRYDGLALLSELRGQIAESIKHRKREIELMERLHREAQLPKYAESTRAYMLRDRDSNALQERREIIDSLMKESVRDTSGAIRKSG
jgi:hypothetical protein